MANSVNQSVNHFPHPLCQVFGIEHISKVIGLKFTYGITRLFCPTQWLALSLSVMLGVGEAHIIMSQYQFLIFTAVPNTFIDN